MAFMNFPCWRYLVVEVIFGSFLEYCLGKILNEKRLTDAFVVLFDGQLLSDDVLPK